MEENKKSATDWFVERFDAIRSLQTDITFEMMNDGLTPVEVRDLILNYKVFDYVERGYDILHLSGMPGIMEEIYEYLQRKGASFNVRAQGT